MPRPGRRVVSLRAGHGPKVVQRYGVSPRSPRCGRSPDFSHGAFEWSASHQARGPMARWRHGDASPVARRVPNRRASVEQGPSGRIVVLKKLIGEAYTKALRGELATPVTNVIPVCCCATAFGNARGMPVSSILQSSFTTAAQVGLKIALTVSARQSDRMDSASLSQWRRQQSWSGCVSETLVSSSEPH